MTGNRVFLDTNVLVYLFDNDEPEKQAIAEKIFQGSEQILLSTQVLQEFYAVVTRRFGRTLDAELANQAVQGFMKYPVETIHPVTVAKAVRRSIDSKITLWDALIVETALNAKVDVLLTEDLHDGWSIGGMRVRNPFAS
ncbi:MAG: PIN domain-containing protein [Gammaproteobacteria bacterium]|nr:PIN domain-containing protein [Gammaproteobacteria bacterium]